MKFIVDAHLPRGLCSLLLRHGHDAIHTYQLPAGNATKDDVINGLSVEQERIVISKDSDFFYSHLLNRRPWKLLLVKTGNITSHELCALLESHLPQIEAALDSHTLVEVDRVSVRPLI